MATINSKQKLVEYIKHKLGAPVINVETESTQLEENVDDAIQRFIRYSGDATYRSTLVLQLSAGIDEYDIDENVVSALSIGSNSTANGINILFSPMNIMANNGMFEFFFNMASGAGSLVMYEIGMEYLKSIERLLTVNFFLEFNKYTHKLKVVPTPDEAMGALLEVYTKYDPGVGASDIYNEIWVKNYAVALSKISLGRILGKYNGTPLPGGGTLNSSELLSEGKSEKEQLEKDLITMEGEPLEMILF